MNKEDLQQLLISSMVSASVCQIYAAMGELPIEELPDEMREKCESLRKRMDINKLETTMFRWHYTKDNDYPDQFAECFCDTGNLHGYQTLTYSGTEFYDRECMEFDVSRWVLSSDVVTVLDRITSLASDADAAFRKYLNDNQTDSAPRTVSVTTTVEMKTGVMNYE